MFALTLVAAVSALEILTYPFSDPDPIPATAETRYPYFRYDGSTERAEMRVWRTVVSNLDPDKAVAAELALPSGTKTVKIPSFRMKLVPLE